MTATRYDGTGGQPQRRDDERDAARRAIDAVLDERRRVPRDAQPGTRTRARRDVVGRGDRVGDAADEREEVRPGLRPGEQRRERARGRRARPRPTTTAEPAPREQRPRPASSPGWILIAAPSAPVDARAPRPRSSHRQPSANSRNRIGPDLAQLDRVQERPRQPGEQHDQPLRPRARPAAPRRRPRTRRAAAPIHAQVARRRRAAARTAARAG